MSSGGGIRNLSIGTVAITSTTFSGNSASSLGGALRNDNPTAGTFNVQNTIVANSISGGNCSGTINSVGNNLDSGNTCGFTGPGDLINTNPLLGPLANNGGPTQTHALLAGSPALNAVAAGCPPPATDQRGITRPQGPACDIGAFEFQQQPTPTPTSTPVVTSTPTPTPTVIPGIPSNIPTLSLPMLVLLGLALAGIALFLLRRF